MNRTIKFRAYVERINEMIQPCFVEIFTDGGFSVAKSYDGNTFPSDWKVSLMQFTGCFDKNDKEVYEGDIVKFKNEPHPQLVSFKEKRLTSGGQGYKTEELFFGFKIGFAFGENNTPEVIGNIFENPELLEK